MSSLLLAASLTFAVLYNVIQARPFRTDLSFRWWVIYSAGGSLAIVALLANVGGLLGRPGVGGYLVGVVVLLIYATTLFVRLVLAPFSRRGTSAED
jgi:hypothetical protein